MKMQTCCKRLPSPKLYLLAHIWQFNAGRSNKRGDAVVSHIAFRQQLLRLSFISPSQDLTWAQTFS